MTPQQKMAWFMLILIGLTGGTVLALYPFLGRQALWALELLALSCPAGAIIFRKKKGVALWDERERQIQARAGFACYIALWIYLIPVCLLLWAILSLHHQEVISIYSLPLILLGALIATNLTSSITVLIQYARCKGERCQGDE